MLAARPGLARILSLGLAQAHKIMETVKDWVPFTALAKRSLDMQTLPRGSAMTHA